MEQKILQIMSRVFAVRPEQLNNQTAKSNLSNWDSLQHLILMSEIEQEFRINFSPEEIQEIESFDGILKKLQSVTSEE